MYYPVLRGRQNELIAVRELADHGLLNSVIPVIEPVKASSTLLRTIESFCEAKLDCYVVMNPLVGVFEQELSSTPSFEAEYWSLIQEGSPHVKPCFYSSDYLIQAIADVRSRGVDTGGAAIFYDRNKDGVFRQALSENYFELCFISDSSRRQVRDLSRVLLSDPFHVLPRNADYRNVSDEFFSEDYKYYDSDGYEGFADYSIVGSAYSEGGFRPRAVALHIVYLHPDGSLYLHHAVSEESDFNDVASLYSSALSNLFSWVDSFGCEIEETRGLQGLRTSYEEGSFPGLGMAKRWSIMHHLELVSNILGR